MHFYNHNMKKIKWTQNASSIFLSDIVLYLQNQEAWSSRTGFTNMNDIFFRLKQ